MAYNFIRCDGVRRVTGTSTRDRRILAQTGFVSSNHDQSTSFHRLPGGVLKSLASAAARYADDDRYAARDGSNDALRSEVRARSSISMQVIHK
ncbi:hypothetical protein TNCV_2868551 [Trichonephila clavipes]|nr:hypothetical protein TNCV_2868551 [Trichonephila clavipes]